MNRADFKLIRSDLNREKMLHPTNLMNQSNICRFLVFFQKTQIFGPILMDKNALFLFDKAVEISFDLSLQSGNSIYPQSQ